MRVLGLILATIIMLGAPSMARAQSTLGPFRLGMTEAQATLAAGGGQLEPNGPNSAQLVVRDAAAFDGRYELRLQFERGALRVILASKLDYSLGAAACADAFEPFVAKLEHAYGPLAGPGGPWESLNWPGATLTRTMTPLGSEMRSYARPFSASFMKIVTTPDPFRVEATARWIERENLCVWMVTVRDDFASPNPYQGMPAPPTAEELAAAKTIEGDWFARRPTIDEMMEFYPKFALDHAMRGRVTLDCLLQVDQTLRCAVIDEAPMGLGFAHAALRAAQTFRTKPSVDGRKTAGARTRLNISFEMPQVAPGNGPR